MEYIANTLETKAKLFALQGGGGAAELHGKGDGTKLVAVCRKSLLADDAQPSKSLIVGAGADVPLVLALLSAAHGWQALKVPKPPHWVWGAIEGGIAVAEVALKVAKNIH